MYKRNNEGIHIINLGKTWEKLMVAARVIAAIPNPKDILVSFIESLLLAPPFVLLHLLSLSTYRWLLLLLISIG